MVTSPTYPDKYSVRLNLEGYMIHREFVKLSYDDWKRLPAEYARKLVVILNERDKIIKERQDAIMRQVRR